MTQQREPADGRTGTEPLGEQVTDRPAGGGPAADFDSEWISIDVVDGDVALVELEAGASYDWQFRADVRQACQATSAVDLDAVVLTGEPGAFEITDGDESDMNDGFGAEQELQATCDAAATLDVPVVAALPGDVRGYGLALAVCSDLRIGVDGSTYGRAGVPPGHLKATGVSRLLVATVGRERASEMLTADSGFDAATMAEWGLLNDVVSEDAVVDSALEFADDFVDTPTDAYTHIKHAVRAATLDHDLGPDVDLANEEDPAPGATTLDDRA